MAAKQYVIHVPEQGVSKKFSMQEALEFFDNELEFYSEIQGVMAGNLSFAGNNLGSRARHYEMAMKQIRSAKDAVQKDNEKGLASYIHAARSLEHIIGAGTIGQHVNKLRSQNRDVECRWLFTVYSPPGQDQHNDYVVPFRALAHGISANSGAADIFSAREQRKSAESAANIAASLQAEFDNFVKEKTSLLGELEDLYRKKLVIDEPALSWRKVADAKRRSWRMWLGFFAVLVLAPVFAAITFWQPFAAAVSQITTANGGAISLAGVAAISVPALLYAWLLKNVSRVFIQNLNLDDDAAHRRALAVTYLGLAENPKITLQETERAIILNALFRPIPPHGGDDGPPSGLVELIRK